MSEHTAAPFDAKVLVLDGPHALNAVKRFKTMLIMIRD